MIPLITDFDKYLHVSVDCMFVIVKDHLYVTGLGHFTHRYFHEYDQMYFIDLLTGGYNQWQATSPMPYDMSDLLEMFTYEGETTTVFVFGEWIDTVNDMDSKFMYMLQCYDVENALWTAFTVAQCMEEEEKEEEVDYQLYFRGDVLHVKGIQQLYQDLLVITKNILKTCWT